MQNLFVKYLTNQCSVEEVKELLAHFNVEENEGMLRDLIKASLLLFQPPSSFFCQR